jgi:hypothetical protein
MKIRYLSDLHLEFVKTTEMEELIMAVHTRRLML